MLATYSRRSRLRPVASGEHCIGATKSGHTADDDDNEPREHRSSPADGGAGCVGLGGAHVTVNGARMPIA